MTQKLHIEHMMHDEWALDLMDQIDILRYKISELDDCYGSDESITLKQQLSDQLHGLIDTFFNKYYIDELVDYRGNFAMELGDEYYLSGKTTTIQQLLDEAARRSANNGQHPQESIDRAKELGCMYIDKTEEGNPGKKHIELIFNSKRDIQTLEKMEEALQKERLNLKSLANTGKPLYKKDYSKEFFNLMKKVEEKYYIDGDIDQWGTIATLWYRFKTVDKFYKGIVREQKKRGKRKSQPKKLVEKAQKLNLIKA